jgi:hypothetical protein
MNEVKEVPAGSDPISVVKGQADTMSKFMEKLNEYKACKDKEQRKVIFSPGDLDEEDDLPAHLIECTLHGNPQSMCRFAYVP